MEPKRLKGQFIKQDKPDVNKKKDNHKDKDVYIDRAAHKGEAAFDVQFVLLLFFVLLHIRCFRQNQSGHVNPPPLFCTSPPLFCTSPPGKDLGKKHKVCTLLWNLMCSMGRTRSPWILVRGLSTFTTALSFWIPPRVLHLPPTFFRLKKAHDSLQAVR